MLFRARDRFAVAAARASVARGSGEALGFGRQLTVCGVAKIEYTH